MPLHRPVYVAFVVGVAVLVAAATQLASLWSTTDNIPASRHRVSCKQLA